MKSNNFFKLFAVILISTIGLLTFSAFAVKKAHLSGPEFEQNLKKAFPNMNIQWDFDQHHGSYQATEQSWSLALPSEKISLQTISSTVEVTGSKNDQIQIHATGDLDSSQYEHLLELVISQDTVLIKDPPNEAAQNLKIKIEIPEKYQKSLTLQTVSGDLQISRLKSSHLEIKTVSGEVDLESSTCLHCEIETVSGDLDVQDSPPGNLVLKTISGDVSLHLSAPDKTHLQIQTMSGEIKNAFPAVSSSSHEVTVTTTSGDVQVD